MTNSLEVSESSVQERINSESEGSLIRRPAIVDMLDLRWFFAERKNFVSFALLLDSIPASFYTSRFTAALLDEFWEKAQWRIILKKFIPFIAFFFISITYFNQALNQIDSTDEPSDGAIVC